MKRYPRGLLIAVGVIAGVVLGIALLGYGWHYWREANLKRVWRSAVAEVTATLAEPGLVDRELAALAAASPPGWVSEHLMVCANGDWLCFANRSSHRNSQAGDWLVARDQAGRWYTSRQHFCLGGPILPVLPQNPQPANLPELLHGYYFVPAPDPQTVPPLARSFRVGGGHFAAAADDAWEARVGLPPYVPAPPAPPTAEPPP
jgi:hypothetical protein